MANYEITKEIWDHLARLYTQSDFVKQYQLESDLWALHQNDVNIQQFYFAIIDLWDQLAFTEPEQLRTYDPCLAFREEQRLVQFVMALHDDFEGIRGNIMHRHPRPFVDNWWVNTWLKRHTLKLKQENVFSHCLRLHLFWLFLLSHLLTIK